MSNFQIYKLCWLSVFVLPTVLLFFWFCWNRWIEPRVGRKTAAMIRRRMIVVSALSLGVCLWSGCWLWNHPIEEYTWMEPRYIQSAERTKDSIALGAQRSFGAHSVEVADDGYGNFLVTVRYVDWLSCQ